MQHAVVIVFQKNMTFQIKIINTLSKRYYQKWLESAGSKLDNQRVRIWGINV